MANIRFSYFYRDGGNYKCYGRVVFRNPDALDLRSIEKALLEALGEGFFVAHQIRVPEVFLWRDGAPTEDDHSFHEFDSLAACLDPSTDTCNRSIADFVQEVREEAARGWHAFDPLDRVNAVLFSRPS